MCDFYKAEYEYNCIAISSILSSFDLLFIKIVYLMTKTGILIDLITVTSGSPDYNIHYLCLTTKTTI